MSQASTVLRWPLWSWRNLVVTTAAVLVVFYGIGRVVEPGKATSPKARLIAATVTTPPTSSSAGSSAVGSSPVRTTVRRETSATSKGSAADETSSLTRVATAFAKAWSSPGRSQAEWTHGIRPYVTPALATGLAQTDPAHVPATKVTGEAVLLKAAATSAQVRVPTDGGSIVVTLHGSSGSWLVSDVAPADQPPGGPTPDLEPRNSAARS
jgi:hypothetical protein